MWNPTLNAAKTVAFRMGHRHPLNAAKNAAFRMGHPRVGGGSGVWDAVLKMFVEI